MSYYTGYSNGYYRAPAPTVQPYYHRPQPVYSGYSQPYSQSHTMMNASPAAHSTTPPARPQGLPANGVYSITSGNWLVPGSNGYYTEWKQPAAPQAQQPAQTPQTPQPPASPAPPSQDEQLKQLTKQTAELQNNASFPARSNSDGTRSLPRGHNDHQNNKLSSNRDLRLLDDPAQNKTAGPLPGGEGVNISGAPNEDVLARVQRGGNNQKELNVNLNSQNNFNFKIDSPPSGSPELQKVSVNANAPNGDITGNLNLAGKNQHTKLNVAGQNVNLNADQDPYHGTVSAKNRLDFSTNGSIIGGPEKTDRTTLSGKQVNVDLRGSDTTMSRTTLKSLADGINLQAGNIQSVGATLEGGGKVKANTTNNADRLNLNNQGQKVQYDINAGDGKDIVDGSKITGNYKAGGTINLGKNNDSYLSSKNLHQKNLTIDGGEGRNTWTFDPTSKLGKDGNTIALRTGKDSYWFGNKDEHDSGLKRFQEDLDKGTVDDDYKGASKGKDGKYVYDPTKSGYGTHARNFQDFRGQGTIKNPNFDKKKKEGPDNPKEIESPEAPIDMNSKDNVQDAPSYTPDPEAPKKDDKKSEEGPPEA